MLIKRLELKHPVRLPTLKFDVDLIEVGTATFEGLILERSENGVSVFTPGLISGQPNELVYLIPEGNIAGMRPMSAAVGAGLTLAELDAAPVPEKLAAAVAKSRG